MTSSGAMAGPLRGWVAPLVVGRSELHGYRCVTRTDDDAGAASSLEEVRSMNEDEVWPAVDTHRRAVVAMLERLTDAQWNQRSLCAEWTVRDVAGHLAWQQNIWTPATVLGMLRARGNMDRAICDIARRHAQRPVEQLIAQLRRIIGTHRAMPTLTPVEFLIDILVHSQDIAVPLRYPLDLPPEPAAVAATRLWTKDTLLPGVKKLKAQRFVATDIDWSVGQGPEVRGPISAILLLFSGRAVAVIDSGKVVLAT